MVSLLWRKLLRDLLIARGRMLMMVIAIAVGIFAITAILSSYTILSREISRNYLGTNPAYAQLELDKVDDSLVEAVRLQPGIADAEASSMVVSRIEKKPGEWMPLLLFVIKDFNAQRINTVKPVSGAWPPSEGSILVEKEVPPLLLNAKVGDALRVQTPNGPKREVTISGLVHDPGLAPAWQEQTAYGYITPSTLAWLGEGSTLNTLKVTLKDQSQNVTANERTVSDLAGWLKQQRRTVEDIRMPPPGKHPHQSQMNAILFMLLIFSFLALVLSAILTATMIGGLLAQQVRQIGIMKSVGARSRQIAGAYLAMVVLMGIVAVILGLPFGVSAGHSFARTIAQLLNLQLYSEAIPGWVYLVLFSAGVLVPLLIARRPIIQATRITIREAINDYGISRNVPGSRRLDTLLGKIRGLDRTLILALRNTFRRRGRLLLTLGLLAAAGGMFMTGLNVQQAWGQYIETASSNRHYDLDIRLNNSEPEKKMLESIASVSGVQQAESWNTVPAALNRSDGLMLERTYPDGGHGSFTMRSVPPGSKMVQSPLMGGRWLQPGDTGTVVLNHMAYYAFYPNVKVGDSIILAIDGHSVTLKVIGIVRQVLTPATAYVSPETFTGAVGNNMLGQSNNLRVALKEHDSNTINAVTKDIEHMLEQEGVSVEKTVSETMMDGALNGHVYIFIVALISLAVAMAIVGTLGLMSTMGTNVTERTREFGVMRTIGGKSGTLMRNVIFEGIFIGLMSYVVAIVLSLPLSIAVGNLIGNLSFRAPLPLVISPAGIAIWLAIIVCGSTAASAYPAWKASQLTVRETLSYI